jgi:hypothetical protein
MSIFCQVFFQVNSAILRFQNPVGWLFSAGRRLQLVEAVSAQFDAVNAGD